MIKLFGPYNLFQSTNVAVLLITILYHLNHLFLLQGPIEVHIVHWQISSKTTTLISTPNSHGPSISSHICILLLRIQNGWCYQQILATVILDMMIMWWIHYSFKNKLRIFVLINGLHHLPLHPNTNTYVTFKWSFINYSIKSYLISM